LQRFLKEGPSAEELQLAKTRILSNYVRIVERVGGFGGKSDLLARCQTYTGKPDCYKDLLQRVRAATPESVRRAAVEWLSDGDYVLEVHPFPTALKAGASIDRKQAPSTGHAEKLSLPPMERTTLSNGLKVVVAERHNAPIVNFSLHVDSGFSSDSPALPGVASFSLRMLEEGTRTRDALRIGRELESLGATFSTSANVDWVSANLNVLKATMPEGLDLFADLVLNPAYAQADFERLQRERLAAIQREKVTPDAMAQRVLPALLYGEGHPYARPMSGIGTEESVGKMTRGDLARFHATWFKPNNATLLVVGDTTLAEVKPRLEALFGKWRQGAVPAKALPQAAPAGKATVYLMDRPGALQSNIVAAMLAPPRNNPDDVTTQVLNSVFGGGFSSRLNLNLREDKHWSYGVRSALPDARGQRAYYSISPIQTDKTADAMKEIVSEYRKVAGAGPITAKELQEAQARLTLSQPGNFETAAQLANGYRTILEFGLPPDYYDTFTQKVLAVTPESANALAARLIAPDRLTWVVVGDMAKVEDSIRALNLGEVRRIDADGKLLQ
ncbi:MAG TPA: insulinase family protein, partial [Usitatibacter sp.]|nr:insulinase family protein [Usitatibacter sp.]